MDRFYFLAQQHPDIYELCTEAENNKTKDISIALLKARQALEKIIHCINPGNIELQDLFTQIGKLSDRSIVSKDELDSFHLIRRIANRAVHGETVSSRECILAIDALFKITGWLVFSVEHKPFTYDKAMSDADKKHIWLYIKDSLPRQNSSYYKVMDQGIDPLSVEIPIAEQEEHIDILDKDVFESDMEYKKRIENLPPVHLGYCILDKSKADEITQIIFPVYHLDKNDRIISQNIAAFFVMSDDVTCKYIDGELLAKLRVEKDTIYFDYNQIWIQTENNRLISLRTIAWSQFAYEGYEDFQKRIEDLPMLPLGICQYMRQKYSIENQELPIEFFPYMYVKKFFQEDQYKQYTIHVDAKFAKKICEIKLAKVYGCVELQEKNVELYPRFIKSDLNSRIKEQHGTRQGLDRENIKRNLAEKVELGKFFTEKIAVVYNDSNIFPNSDSNKIYEFGGSDINIILPIKKEALAYFDIKTIANSISFNIQDDFIETTITIGENNNQMSATKRYAVDEDDIIPFDSCPVMEIFPNALFTTNDPENKYYSFYDSLNATTFLMSPVWEPCSRQQVLTNFGNKAEIEEGNIFPSAIECSCDVMNYDGSIETFALGIIPVKMPERKVRTIRDVWKPITACIIDLLDRDGCSCSLLWNKNIVGSETICCNVIEGGEAGLGVTETISIARHFTPWLISKFF